MRDQTFAASLRERWKLGRHHQAPTRGAGALDKTLRLPVGVSGKVPRLQAASEWRVRQQKKKNPPLSNNTSSRLRVELP
jgi:hypothetical protein